MGRFDNIQPINDAERLIILRKRLNLSQFQFAKELGISASYLGQIERGTYTLNAYLKERIDKYMKREEQLYEKNLFSDK